MGETVKDYDKFRQYRAIKTPWRSCAHEFYQRLHFTEDGNADEWSRGPSGTAAYWKCAKAGARTLCGRDCSDWDVMEHIAYVDSFACLQCVSVLRKHFPDFDFDEALLKFRSLDPVRNSESPLEMVELTVTVS